jgi:hypothetical protein
MNSSGAMPLNYCDWIPLWLYFAYQLKCFIAADEKAISRNNEERTAIP